MNQITITPEIIRSIPNDMELGAYVRSLLQEPVQPPASQVVKGQVTDN